MPSDTTKWLRQLARVFMVFCLAMAGSAMAAPVRWTITDARFNDGGTITGSFVFDAAIGGLTEWNVSVAGGNLGSFPTTTYANNTAAGFMDPTLGNPQPAVVLAITSATMRQIRITPSTAFTDAGGTIPINLSTADSGSGSIECFNCTPFRTIVSGSLVGARIEGFEVRAGITGNWYDPAQNGHGFQLEVLPGGIATAFWFTFDNAGNPVWISAAGPITGNRIVMSANRAIGGRFPPNFNPANVTTRTWGTLTFTFTDCDHGSVTWAATESGFTASGTMALERLTRIDTLVCN